MKNAIHADLTAMQHQYSAKRSGQSRAEYAACIQGHRKPASKWGYCIAAALLLAAAWLGAQA